jgi:hypothetical protein
VGNDPVADGRAAAFRDARLVNVEGAGHWVHTSGSTRSSRRSRPSWASDRAGRRPPDGAACARPPQPFCFDPRPSRSAASTCSGWASAFATRAQCLRTLPSGPIQTVERITPVVFFPYSIFSP